MSIKALFLDFYGTVVQEETASLLKICKIISEASARTISPEEVGYFWMKQFNQLLVSSHGENFLTQREISTFSLSETINEFSANVNIDEFVPLLFSQWNNPVMYDDAVLFFAQNKLPVYILSNVDHEDLTEAIQLLGITTVKGIITSELVKAYKPHHHMFEYALKVSGLSPNEVIHVGDSLTSDVLGASQAGIKSAWLNRTDIEITGNYEPTIVIKHLFDLLHMPKLVNQA